MNMGFKTGAVALAFALTLGIAASTLHARPKVDGGARKSCKYEGKEYSDGAVIKQADGNKYRCDDGKWTYAGHD
jgi:Protein of unknown function (DUF1496)